MYHKVQYDENITCKVYNNTQSRTAKWNDSTYVERTENHGGVVFAELTVKCDGQLEVSASDGCFRIFTRRDQRGA